MDLKFAMINILSEEKKNSLHGQESDSGLGLCCGRGIFSIHCQSQANGGYCVGERQEGNKLMTKLGSTVQ